MAPTNLSSASLKTSIPLVRLQGGRWGDGDDGDGGSDDGDGDDGGDDGEVMVI